MSVATLAYGARQSLARGLEALQALDAPPALLDVAQPVARAMGVLVELERAPEGLVAARVEPALAALREGLRLLQLPEHVEHPAAARGMAAVAETLGVVVELALSITAQPAAPSPAPTSARAEPAPIKVLSVTLAPDPPEAVRVRSLVAASAPRAEPGPPPLTRVTQPAPVSSQPPSVPRPPLPDKPPEPKVVIARNSTPTVIRKAIARDAELRAIEAPLGTHSPSNFYTGLSGGEVVTSGGVFVATYQPPKVGETVLLEVSMPGGYEFVAKAIVAWTRSAGEAATGTQSMRACVGPPGFGARFVEVTEEGRRLVQRYVRNREPLFHDDA
jgi:Tfp pilus assembly protein PilZ